MTKDTLDGVREQRLNEVLLAYMKEVQAGRVPDRRQLLAAHADLRELLEEFFASHDEVDRLAAPIRKAAGCNLEDESRNGQPSAASHFELGQLGDFRLVREIGRGGMGVVYEAEQLSLRRRVALKVLPFAAAIDPRQLQRFHNEALAAGHLRHENIVPVYAVGSERGVHYYAMQLVEGQSLAALIGELSGLVRGPSAEGSALPDRPASPAETTGPAPAAAQAETNAVEPDHLLAATVFRERTSGGRRYFHWVADLGRQAALALEHAHQMGIIHRDVKPANLLLDLRGQLWVTDFGLAQFNSDLALTVTGEVLGTLRYASPEQSRARPGLVDHRSDVYSLGATLYEMVTLRPIFDARDRLELLGQIADEEPRRPRSIYRAIPAELETIILKAVAKEPHERYATAQELADDLQRFLEDRPIRARRQSLAEKATKWSRRHRSVVVSVLVALLLTVAGLAVVTVLTARAYDRERQKAEEAQESFDQARRAVDQFAQISEAELAGKPHLEGLRKRLLETALAYYEEFIEQRRHDPGALAKLSAAQERVRKILTDLAVLQGAGQFSLLTHPPVLDDLEASPEQRQQIGEQSRLVEKRRQESFREFHRLTSEERRQRFVDLARDNETVMVEILTPDQLDRLGQIALQLRGPGALLETEVASALKLTTQQKERIRAIVMEKFFAKPGRQPGSPVLKTPGGGAGSARTVQEQTRKATDKRIQAILSEEQAKQWAEMTGKPFQGPAPFRPPPGSFGRNRGPNPPRHFGPAPATQGNSSR
jgi:serine/threonine protein kinase